MYVGYEDSMRQYTITWEGRRVGRRSWV